MKLDNACRNRRIEPAIKTIEAAVEVNKQSDSGFAESLEEELKIELRQRGYGVDQSQKIEIKKKESSYRPITVDLGVEEWVSFELKSALELLAIHIR